MMSAADAVKRVRTEIGLGQKDFAEKLSLTKTAVYNYEAGLRVPKLSVIKKIKELAKENGIEISTDDFLN